MVSYSSDKTSAKRHPSFMHINKVPHEGGEIKTIKTVQILDNKSKMPKTTHGTHYKIHIQS